MDDQQSYKSPKKIFDLIKGGINEGLKYPIKKLEDLLNKKVKKAQEKANIPEIKRSTKVLEYPIKELGDLLYEMAKNAQEKFNLSEIKGLASVIDLYCNKRGNEPMWCGYYIDADVYSKDDGIRCLSNTPYLVNRVKCTNYSDKSFELSDSLQSISFVQGIRNSILDIYNILNPGVLTDMGEQYIHIRAIVSMDPNKPMKDNQEINKYSKYGDKFGYNNEYSDKFSYNNGKYNIEMLWHFYDSSKL